MASSILNSDDGVISGTSGLKSSGGDDGTLKIQANGVDAISINASQVVTFANSPSGVASLSTASGSAPSYSARAWVNFNGTGTVAIREDGNVSSITDNNTGDYTVNFTTAMPDANYCYTMAVEDASITLVNTNFTSFSKTTSSIRTGTRYISSLSGSAVADDADSVCVAIFR